METRVALTNLGKYNEGELYFEWLELPFTQEEFRNTLKAIEVAEGTPYEEYFVSDVECDDEVLRKSIGEYPDLKHLNELVEKLNELDDEDRVHAVLMVLDDNGTILDFEECLEVFNRIEDTIIYYSAENYDELGRELVDGTMEIDEWIEPYFDYNMFGRDACMERNTIEDFDYGIVVWEWEDC